MVLTLSGIQLPLRSNNSSLHKSAPKPRSNALYPTCECEFHGPGPIRFEDKFSRRSRWQWPVRSSLPIATAPAQPIRFCACRRPRIITSLAAAKIPNDISTDQIQNGYTRPAADQQSCNQSRRSGTKLGRSITKINFMKRRVQGEGIALKNSLKSETKATTHTQNTQTSNKSQQGSQISMTAALTNVSAQESR